jgi:histidine ammonia-lyase
VLSASPAFRRRIRRGADILARALAAGQPVYGVTTGYGDNCTTEIPSKLVAELPDNLIRYHAVGTGEPLSPEVTRAVMLCRLQSLCRGFSGVRPELLELLAGMLRADILPLIPSEGSVGASGDLTPLSYLAAAMTGRRQVRFRGREVPAAKALAAAGLRPLRLAPKEGLALMNGTAVMTGIACLGHARAARLSRLAARLAAASSHALGGNPGHFDRTLFSVKPHAGQVRVATWIREDLGPARGPASRIQDRYSIRCAPHVIGVLEDALDWVRRDLENELNSANDNPIVDPVSGRILHGGHFYGGHVAFAMDSLKAAVASLADLMDRQLALLVDARYSNGLPQGLASGSGPRAPLQHGLKALQISASAWTAEALRLCMPAAAFSRSTEAHNQDKVSMGTIAARDCARVLELAEQVAAALVLASSQGLRLRARLPGGRALPSRLAAFRRQAEARYGRQDEDRELDAVVARCAADIRDGAIVPRR